jgi:AraC-like DNA-binding protein
MMSGYRETAVHPALAPRIVCTWTDTRVERSLVLPDACIDIVWDGTSLEVVGPSTGPIQVPAVAAYVGIRFRPGAASGFLGVPATELRDRSVDLAELWGGPAVELADRLAAVDPAEAGRTLEQLLLRQVDAAPPADSLVQHLMRDLSRGRPLHACARELGVNERTLHRRCSAALGYGPKMLERILRFRRALTIAQAEPAALADTAFAAGYADQAHLSREFRRLAGATPTELFGSFQGAISSNGLG